jgi:hypothetical protein
MSRVRAAQTCRSPLRALRGEESVLRDQLEHVSGTGHADIEAAPLLLLDVLGLADGEIRRDAAIDDVHACGGLSVDPENSRLIDLDGVANPQVGDITNGCYLFTLGLSAFADLGARIVEDIGNHP